MPSANACKSNQTNRTTRCPHVILLGKSFRQILELKLKQFEYTQLQNSIESNLSVSEKSESDESNDRKESLVCLTNKNDNYCNGDISLIKCHDCECSKNLWLCLKDNCYYIGCGQDSSSNKHSSLHALRSYHPLSINLTTKNVWCEQCSIRVILESNIPSIDHELERVGKFVSNAHYLTNNSSNCLADDYDFISFLDSESLLNEELNRTNFNEIGQIGLDNLGNTCYMSSALQALSNCFAFTSFFLECSSYVNHIVNLNKSLQQSTISTPLTLKYMRLMKDLWQPTKRLNPKTNKIQHITSLSPVDFVNTVKLINPLFRGFQQNDTQEFLIYLMDQLHEELKRPILIPSASMATSTNSESDSDDTLTNTCDKDSGVSSNWTKSAQEDRDSESIDSYVTCGDDELRLSLDLSDNLDYSDADECFSSNKTQCKGSKEKVEKSKGKLIFTSIISETFEGKLISQVKCLECNNISTTTESFLHLSIPIPSREYLQMLHGKMSHDSDQENQSNGWIGWFFDFMKGYVWSNPIQLSDCLLSFFSDDDLKDENMYSCEKCKKLTNGVKNSKILNLPEVLIIHLKRFRHDSMFSTGKINSYVSFPLDNLNMQPFVHSNCQNEITQYDLSSVICHYGGSEGGHYISYARNHFNEEWYEYDDSFCRQVESLSVQNCQGYVLFYKKKNIKTDGIKDYLRDMLSSRVEDNFGQSILRPYYISKQWVHKLKYFGECGAIDNTDFVCKHNFVYPKKWKIINDLAIPCTQDTWTYLVENFGIKYNLNAIGFKNECNYLYPCKQCQLNDEALKQRQLYEKEEFLRLQDKWNQEKNSLSNPDQISVYAISKSWFKEWEKFVQLNECPMEHQIPGEINNYPICLPDKQRDKSKSKNHQLNSKISNFKISEDMWKFLLGIYGGGPELLVSSGSKNLNGNKERSYNGKSNL